jgi:2-polyprenyl-3-methyl-5-hydroxy-6-metoxy-1,4-benzoquinol methylase
MNTRNHAGSPDRFGYEWANYSEILPESKRQLERWLGATGLASFKGKRVMDVGCGMGRNPYWYLEAGAASVLAVDVDEGSLGAARRNLAPFANAKVDQRSVYELDPEVVGRFDRVTCIGVLHHLEDSRSALDRMWACVEPGGDLVLWCYGREGNTLILPLIQGLRAIGSRAPIKVSHAIAKAIAVGAWPVLQVAPFRTDYYRWIRSLSFRNIESIIFDQMLPRISHYYTEEDMRALVRPLPSAVPFIEHVQGNSWHARITKRRDGESP